MREVPEGDPVLLVWSRCLTVEAFKPLSKTETFNDVNQTFRSSGNSVKAHME